MLTHVIIVISLLLMVSACAVAFARGRSNIHLRFWVGDWFLGMYLLLLSALVTTTMLVLYRHLVMCIRLRRQEVRNSRPQARSQKDTEWRLSKRSLITILGATATSAFGAAALGLVAMRKGHNLARDIGWRCGATGASRELELFYQQLMLVRSRCQLPPGASTELCPGYNEALDTGRPFLRYLEVAEDQLKCTGFCYFRTMSAINGNTPVGTGQVACAQVLNQQLQAVIFSHSLTCIIAGCAVGLLSLALLTNSEL